MLDRLAADIVSALRSLYAAPALPVAAILTTALAVGMNMAMLGLIDRALLTPPPHSVSPERVFTLGFEVSRSDADRGVAFITSYPAFEAIRDRAPGVTAAAWHSVPGSAMVGDHQVPVKAAGVTGAYFDMLAVRAWRGRTILPDDDRPPTGAPVAVLSHSLWKRAFGADEQVVGQRLTLGGLALQVIGVMPAGFGGHSADRIDLWLPLGAALQNEPGWETRRTMAILEIGVRLAPGQTADAAASQLGAASGTRVILFPIIGADVAPAPHRIAFWLAAVSLVVLVAGLANVATLFLVRGARRRRESSIRAALGATRSRLFRQVFIESAIVASVAAGVALVLGYWLDEVVRSVLFPSLVETSGMTRQVAVAAGIGGACTLLVAAGAGAWQLPGQVRAADLLGTRRIWRRATAQKELLIVQATLAVLLITGAGLFGRTYFELASQDPDARLDDVLVVFFDDGPGSVPNQDHLLATAVDRVRALPGVTAATVFAFLPFRGVMAPPISVPGIGGEPRLDGDLPFLIESTPELFEILRIGIVEGRRFTAADDRGAAVAIVSETMARGLWPGTSALGKCFRIGFDPAWDPATATGPPVPPASAPCREVVGIARDWRRTSADGGHAQRRVMHYYVPFSQGVRLPRALASQPTRIQGLLVRHRTADDALAGSIRRAVVDGRGDLPFVEIRPYATPPDGRLAPWLIGTKLLLLFGALALATAAVGIHAAFAHAVAERQHEIAIRLAVGASRRRVLLMMLREGGAVAASGVMYGAAVSLLVDRVLGSTVVGVSSSDPLAIGLAGTLVLIAAILATWFPALTASRADPNVLLRVE